MHSPFAANFVKNALSLNAYLTQSTNTYQILDSGASDHMCSQVNMFSSLNKQLHPINVPLPNGQFISILYSSTVPILDGILLDKALYVPSFKFNLLSSSRLTQQLGCSVWFTLDTCFMQGCSLRIPLVLGKTHGGLYIFTPYIQASSVSIPSTSFSASSNIFIVTSVTSKTFDCNDLCYVTLDMSKIENLISLQCKY